jgi:hypothetical protein
MVTAMGPTVLGTPGAIVTPENAAAVWNKLEAYDAIAKRLRSQVEKHAARGPIDLGNGRQLRMALGTPKDKVLDARKAIGVLRSHLDEQAAQEGIAATKTSLIDATKAWARRTGAKVGATAETIEDKLREAGAIAKVAGEEKVREVQL